MRIFTNASLLLFIVSILHSAPLALETKMVEEDDGGEVSRFMELSGAGFNGVHFPNANWFLAEQKPKDASIRFSNRSIDSVVMDFSVFPSQELLSDYSEASVQKYVEKLTERHASKGLQIKNVVATKSQIGGAGFMGRAYWRVRYDIHSPQLNAVKSAVCDYLSLNGKHNFLLRFSGNQEDISRLESGFGRIVSKFADI